MYDWETYRDDKFDSNPNEILAQIDEGEPRKFSARLTTKNRELEISIPFGAIVFETIGEGDDRRLAALRRGRRQRFVCQRRSDPAVDLIPTRISR